MQGDWHPDATLRPTIINVQLANDGAVHHVGLGFDVISPNGNVIAQRGWTWDVPDDHRADLERVMNALVADVMAAEGVGGVEYVTLPAPMAAPELPADGLRRDLTDTD